MSSSSPTQFSWYLPDGGLFSNQFFKAVSDTTATGVGKWEEIATQSAVEISVDTQTGTIIKQSPIVRHVRPTADPLTIWRVIKMPRQRLVLCLLCLYPAISVSSEVVLADVDSRYRLLEQVERPFCDGRTTHPCGGNSDICRGASALLPKGLEVDAKRIVELCSTKGTKYNYQAPTGYWKCA